MAINQRRTNTKNTSRENPMTTFDKFFGVFSKGSSGTLPADLLPKLMLLVVLGIIYIANNHYANRTTLRTDNLKNEVDELIVDYTTLKSRFMMRSKQSEVALAVQPLGLQESAQPPYKLEIDKNDPLIEDFVK